MIARTIIPNSSHFAHEKQQSPNLWGSPVSEPSCLSGMGRRKVYEALPSLAVDNDGLHLTIAIDDILYLQAEHVYLNIFFQKEQRVMQRGSLSALLAQLPETCFFRVHRSYGVNLGWVEGWTSKEILLTGGHRIPLSRGREMAFKASLKKFNLLDK